MSAPTYYRDDEVTLYLGDCRELVPALGLVADCVVADPPYGETDLVWDRWPDGWPGVMVGATRSMWCFGSMRMFLTRRDEFAEWKLSQDVVWRKQESTGRTTDRFRRVHEHALHWYHGSWGDTRHETPRENTGVTHRKPTRRHAEPEKWNGAKGSGVWVDDGTRIMRSVIEAPNMWKRGVSHPTEKPVGILDPLIRYACPPSGTVLDPFAGSGSTAEAARQAGRKAILIEADERYCETIARRMSQTILTEDASS